jgi:hypothetical protein
MSPINNNEPYRRACLSGSIPYLYLAHASGPPTEIVDVARLPAGGRHASTTT